MDFQYSLLVTLTQTELSGYTTQKFTACSALAPGLESYAASQLFASRQLPAVVGEPEAFLIADAVQLIALREDNKQVQPMENAMSTDDSSLT